LGTRYRCIVYPQFIIAAVVWTIGQSVVHLQWWPDDGDAVRTCINMKSTGFSYASYTCTQQPLPRAHHSTDSRERPNEMESLAAFELWIGLLACGGLRTRKCRIKLIASAFVFLEYN
jgi:hypothetical protein